MWLHRLRHDHGHDEHEEHGRFHGLIDRSILRSRAGIRAVSLSPAILTATALAQGFIYTRTLSVALLADLIHNFGDALTAIPLGIAFYLRSARGERYCRGGDCTSGYVGAAVFIAFAAIACLLGSHAAAKARRGRPQVARSATVGARVFRDGP
jgi:divalent metal cation (Fe/Co/Zn/Cd) transporter